MVLKPEGMYPEKWFHFHKLLVIAPLIFFLIQSKGVWNLGLIELYCILKFQIGLITVLLRLTDTKQFHIMKQSSWYKAEGIIPLICKSGRMKQSPENPSQWDTKLQMYPGPAPSTWVRTESGVTSSFFAGLNPWYQWHSLFLFILFLSASAQRTHLSPDLLWFSFLLLLPRAWIQPVRNPYI